MGSKFPPPPEDTGLPPALEASIGNLIRELHRRSIWQVIGVFLGISWIVVEMVDFITERAGLPDWTPTMAFVAMLLGLPVVVATAFVQEGAPGRAEREGPSTESETGDAGTSATEMPRVPSAVLSFLTWRNAIMGGLGAFTLLGMALVGYFVLWSSGIGSMGSLVAQGVFEEGEPLVLADFQDNTDQDLGSVVTQAIRVDLQESAVIDLVPPSYVRGGLARMGLPDDTPFTPDLALELAQRDGLKAVIQGEISAVGGDYLLTASLVATSSGEILKAFRVPVEDEEGLLDGIDKLSQDIREKSGESLRSIRQGRGLEQATTSSLDALRIYSEAVALFNRGRQLEAIPGLEEALALDPEFAQAWRKLSVILRNQGLEHGRVVDASRRAYDLRHRLTEREAWLAEAWYRNVVDDNSEASIEVYRRVLEKYPTDPASLNNIAVRLQFLGEWDEATLFLGRLVTLPGGTTANGYGNYVASLWSSGEPAQAQAWLDTLTARYPDAVLGRSDRAAMHAALGEWDEAHDILDRLLLDAPVESRYYLWSLAELAGADLARGRWSEAQRHLEQSVRDAAELGSTELFHLGPAFISVAAEQLSGSPASLTVKVNELREAIPPDQLGPRSTVWPVLAQYQYVAGNTAQGDRDWEAYAATFEADERGRQFRIMRETLRAVRAMAEGDGAAAAESYDRVHLQLAPCGDRCAQSAQWGMALEEAGRIEEAIDRYRLFLDDVPLSWHLYLTAYRGPVMERLGALLEEQGDAAGAAEVYQMLIDEFEGGDGPFVAMVERARTRLAAIG